MNNEFKKLSKEDLNMSLSKIFNKIFGEQIFNEPSGTETDKSFAQKGLDPPLPEQFSKVKVWLANKLKTIEEKYHDMALRQELLIESRIGPDKVMFDIDTNSTIRISCDKLTIRSQGSFNTIKTNTCVFRGKWMYEVQLHSKGVMQIGWCSNECIFNENSGVGDTVYSYGFDGSKQQKWHMSTNKYGAKWQTGDIIGVCFNIDKRFIEYYRNGVSLGIAFENIEKGPGIAFFPAVSLGYSEGLKANFGNSPLRFPIPGYSVLQPKPYENIEISDLLLRYIVNLAGILSRPKYRQKEKKLKDGRFSTKKTIYVLFSSILIEKLAEYFLDPYVIEDVFIPYIMNLCVIRTETDKDIVILPGSLESTLGTLLSLLWNYLEPDEMKFVMKKLLNVLLGKYSQTVKELENDSQRKVIVVLNCLCTHPVTRKFYLETKFFKKHCLSLLMYLRPPEYVAMMNVLPDKIIWTEGAEESKETYLLASENLAKTVDALYSLQKNFLRNLLTNNDGDSSFPSSRKIFTNKLRKYVMDTSVEQRPLQSLYLMQSSILHPIESPVALSFLCILIDVIKQLFEEEHPGKSVAINTQMFFDGSFQYPYFDRVGGILSHLYKVHRNDIAQELGTDGVSFLGLQDQNSLRVGDMDASVLFTPANLNNISMLGRSQRSTTSSVAQMHFYHQQIEDPTPGNANTIQSLYELLDISVLYYYSVGHKYIVKISAVRDELAVLNDVLIETKKNREEVEKQLNAISENNFSTIGNEVLVELNEKNAQREHVFAKRYIELTRKQAWYRTVALGKQRRNLLKWLLKTILNTLKQSSDMGALFAFVPEVYINILPILLDTILDFSFHDLSLQFDISDSTEEIAAAAMFLGEHSADPRIVLATCKDSLLQALGTLICHEAGIRALESSPTKRGPILHLKFWYLATGFLMSKALKYGIFVSTINAITQREVPKNLGFLLRKLVIKTI